MKKIIVMIICLLACGCGMSSNETLSQEEINDIMVNNQYQIIDVRTKEEFDSGHVNKAINIPYDEIEDKIDIDKEIIIFVYCKSGNRSNIAYNTLKRIGYTVYDLGAYEKIDLEKTIQ